jgi:transposase
MNEQTRTKNGIRSFLVKKGLANPAGDLRQKDARDLVVRQCARLGESAKVILNSKLAALDSVEARLESIRPLVTQRAADRPEAALLLTVPGIELTMVLTMMATIDTIDRFPTPGSLVKYAGLVPREKSSAGKVHRGGVKRTGSRALRWAATQATLTAIKQPGTLRDLYRRLSRKGHSVAICACARKLLTIVWHLLVKKEPFRETPPASQKRKDARVKRKVAKAKVLLPERRVVLENLLKHAPQLKELAGVRHGLPLSLRPVSWRGPEKFQPAPPPG